MDADKLRELNDRLLTCGNDYSDVLLDGAAEIERLRVDRDKLRADLQFMVENAAVKHRPAYDEQQLIIMALRDRVAELEAAHRSILVHTGRLPGAPLELLNGLLDSCARIARKALAAKEGE